MAKVAVLVPNQELELIAQPLTEEFSSLQVMEVKYIRTAYAVQRARELEQQGCDTLSWRAACRHGSSSAVSASRSWRSLSPRRSWPV